MYYFFTMNHQYLSHGTDAERQRILSILETEFDKELQAKEDEIMEVQERIIRTQRILQYLCYAVVSDFYSREKTITSVSVVHYYCYFNHLFNPKEFKNGSL